METMSLEAARNAVLGAVDAAEAELVSAARKIHARPELGGEEVFASALAASILEASGFEVERGYAGLPTAFLARKRRGQGRRVAFLAEYDALPELGHACGHNLICASALAAGLGLGAALDAGAASGEVLVYGTPAEETDGAKAAMAGKGLFDGLDAALMAHPYAGSHLLTESLAMDALEVEFAGLSSHAAASPWEGRNALDGVILLFTGLNALRQQLRPDARVHGIVSNGGAAPNVIPDRAAARFYLRAGSRAYLDAVSARFRDCVAAAALASGTRAETRNYEASFDDMVNSRILAARFGEHAAGRLGLGPFGGAPDSFGSIDMGNVSRRAPSIHILFDIAGGSPLTAHSPAFREAAASPRAERAMLAAGKALALTGLDVLLDEAFAASARAEFEASAGRAGAAGPGVAGQGKA